MLMRNEAFFACFRCFGCAARTVARAWLRWFCVLFADFAWLGMVVVLGEVRFGGSQSRVRVVSVGFGSVVMRGWGRHAP